MLNHSLSQRLLVTITVLLVLFFGVTTAVLDSVFRDASETAMRDRLDIQALVLMAASEERPRAQLVPDTEQLDPRYLNPNSGLYAQIVSGNNSVWHSPSLLKATLPIVKVRPGTRSFRLHTLSNGKQVRSLNIGLSWEFSRGTSRDLVFTVAESLEQYQAQLQRFRWRLFGGFAGMSLLLILSLAWTFRRVLTPLRRIENEIEEIEAGRLAELGAGYPRELDGVTTNMNTLLRSERDRLTRYRNTLGNLAHSLKTPLAVMRNQLATNELRELPAARQLDEQVSRMDDIVRYQLKRAAASAGMSLGNAPVSLHEVIDPLVSTLQKVYFERRMGVTLNLPSECSFTADRDDLMELIGNLLDNAFKYGREQVRISAEALQDEQARRGGVLLVVEDDGPGIAAAQRTQVLERGTRLDERTSGQGIGLAVVRELAELYRGRVDIDASPLGGARITVRLLAT